MTDAGLQQHTTNTYEKLWDGRYLDNAGRHMPVKGDVSKISQIIGLTQEEKALVSNFHFMSARLAGTRQMRRHMGHIVRSSLLNLGMSRLYDSLTQRATFRLKHLAYAHPSERPGLDDWYSSAVPRLDWT